MVNYLIILSYDSIRVEKIHSETIKINLKKYKEFN